MYYSDFLHQAKELVHQIEYGPVSDEFDVLTKLKQVIIERQKTLLEYARERK